MAHKTLHLKARTHHSGDTVTLDFGDVSPESQPERDTAAALVDFFVPAASGTPPMSTVILQSDLNSIKTTKRDVTLTGAGAHSVFLVIFDKGGDNNFRFLSFHADTIQVIP